MKGKIMAETKKCPKCGGTIHNKIAGKYICSQCGNAIEESEVIIVKDSEPEKVNTSASSGTTTSGSDWSYQSFETPTESGSSDSEYWEPEAPKKAEKAKKEKVKSEKKRKEPKQPRQKVYSAKVPLGERLANLDYTLWWPIIAAGVAGICFTLIFILMIINKFQLLPLWCTFLSLSAYLMTSLLLWPVFDKAGESPWKALVPIYSSYTLFEISGYKGWRFFLTLIPTIGQILGCLFGALTAISLAKKFGKDLSWGIIYLFILFPVGWVMIAVTNMTYNSRAGHQKDMPPFQFF